MSTLINYFMYAINQLVSAFAYMNIVPDFSLATLLLITAILTVVFDFVWRLTK